VRYNTPYTSNINFLDISVGIRAEDKLTVVEGWTFGSAKHTPDAMAAASMSQSLRSMAIHREIPLQ
jgi:hypothetical protein